jgi:hypothetical protein
LTIPDSRISAVTVAFPELFGDFAKEKISGGLDLTDLLKVSPVKY